MTPKDHSETEKSEERFLEWWKDSAAECRNCSNDAWKVQDAHYRPEVERLTAEIKELRSWSNEHRKQRDDLQEENNRLTKKVEELKAMTETRHQLEQKEAEIARLREALKKLDHGLDTFMPTSIMQDIAKSALERAKE